MADVFLLRVALPDRPGSLGQVAEALGRIGADISAVEVVGREGDERVVDDFMLTLPEGVLPDTAVSVCTELEGVSVLWFSRYPRGGGLQADVEALERMLAEPKRALEILADAAPDVFRAHWAVLIDTAKDQALYATAMAPELDSATLGELGPFRKSRTFDLAAGWTPNWPDTTVAVAPVRGARALLVGRHGGPRFLDVELARLRYLAALAPQR